MIIEVTAANIAVLECFASVTRVTIIELLGERPRNIKELAEQLGVSSAIVTKHVQKLEDAGLVRCESTAGKRGMQKVCHLAVEQATLLFQSPLPAHSPSGSVNAAADSYSVSIPIGQYSACEVKPTCGLSSDTKLIGLMDDPRYFADPEHVKAGHLWFASGYIEYRIPNYMLRGQSVRSLRLSLELCSEAPGYNEQWPSDIAFSVNGTELGVWTCPGDYGASRGVFTPEWFKLGTQHGLLKTIVVDERGTFLDGLQLSPVTVHDLNIAFGQEIAFRLTASESAKYAGGISLFGRSFGNYNQDIEVTVQYADGERS